MAGVDQLAHAGRRQRDAVLVRLDLGGNADLHAGTSRPVVHGWSAWTSSPPRSASQNSIRSRRRGQVAAGQLLDPADPVAQRVAVAVQPPRRALPLAVLLDERLERAHQLAAVVALAVLDRAEDRVAEQPQRLVVLQREQQLEGARGRGRWRPGIGSGADPLPSPLPAAPSASASSAQRASWKLAPRVARRHRAPDAGAGRPRRARSRPRAGDALGEREQLVVEEPGQQRARRARRTEATRPRRPRRAAPRRAPPRPARAAPRRPARAEHERRDAVAEPERLEPARELGAGRARRRRPRRARRRPAGARCRRRRGGAAARARRSSPPGAGSAGRTRPAPPASLTATSHASGTRAGRRRPAAATPSAATGSAERPVAVRGDGHERRAPRRGARARAARSRSAVDDLRLERAAEGRAAPASSPRASNTSTGPPISVASAPTSASSPRSESTIRSQPLLRRERPAQDRVLLVDELRERRLGDRDERHLVGHLEHREVALGRRLEQRLGHLVVREARCRSRGRRAGGRRAARRTRAAPRRVSELHARWSAAARRRTATASGRAARRCAPSGPAGRGSPRRRAGGRRGRCRRSRTVSIAALTSCALQRRAVGSTCIRSPASVEHAAAGSPRSPRTAPGPRSAAARAGSPGRRGRRRGRSGRGGRARRTRKPRSSVSDSSSSKRLLGVLVLDQLDRVEVAGAAHVADDREVAQRLEHRRGTAPSFSRTFSRMPSFSNASMFASATAAAHRVPAEREAVREDVEPVQERLGDPVGGDHRAHRRVGAASGPSRW